MFFPIGGCLADSDVAVMVYMLTQDTGYDLKGRTGRVRYVIRYRMQRMNNISSLNVQLTVTLGTSMQIFFSKLVHVQDQAS